MRNASVSRNTAETRVAITLNVDGKGRAEIESGAGFLDHMLTLLAFHGGMDLRVKCEGDLHVDAHHTAEDIGVMLGKAVSEALGDRRGIARYGQSLLPMDEALILCALDLSGRTHLNFDVEISAAKVGEFDTELVKEFFYALVRSLPMALHFKKLAGENTHHVIEACFKGFGRALRQAVSKDSAMGERTPSSKGTLL